MNPWLFLPIGYVLTILIEGPILFAGLSDRHDRKRRVLAALWLTACTYPIVVLVAPTFLDPVEQRGLYLLTAEPFAAAFECFLFLFAFHGERGYTRSETTRDCTTIVVANVMSFGIGELLYQWPGFHDLLERLGG